MRRIREERTKLNKGRKKLVFQLDEEDFGTMEVKERKVRAKTKRGNKLLEASEVNNRLVQKGERLGVVGADVEALYPSLEAIQVANIVYQAIMETDIGFEGVNYLEGARYIALTSSAQECRLGPLGRVLPRRRHVNGTRPGVTGAGPAGAHSDDQNQWKFPEVELTDREKRMIIAKVMHTAVLTLFQTHTYTFGGKFYLQKHGGPIGLRSTCCIARIVMLWWDRQLLEIMEQSNLTVEEKIR